MLTLAGTSFTLNIFCTNAPQNDHRVAYANFNGTIYKLSGTTVTAVSTGGSDYSNVPTSNSASCAYFNGEVYFSSGYCMTTNENYTTDATHLYYAYASYIGYKNTSGETGVGYVGDVVYSLGITKDYIMVGTENGLQHGLLSGNVPALFTSEFTTNAESALSSYYEIWALLVVNPALSEISGDIYASTSYTGSSSSTSATFDNIGLWAYYPYRLEWNRE